MTPTSEATGTFPNSGAPYMIPAARNNAILIPDHRAPPPPLCALMILWPSKAHPPIPPVKPLIILPTPCPMHSCFVEPRLPSSTIPSTICIVNSDSMVPTAAIVMAKGRTIFSVSKENGTAGNASLGIPDKPPANVSDPATSARVWTGSFKYVETRVETITAPRVGGMTFVILGKSFTTIIVRAVSPYMLAPAADRIDMKASPFTRK
mmetsp:Transcript_17561/g.31727  ORF Transcript_17561/g.31727 Transcript_17561/m.31727 type:complete len:207 (+) Transcript_17561:670-1290(+)